MIGQRFKELGLTLPEAPKPVAAYVPAARTRDMLFISGQIPMKDGVLMATGTVPDKVSEELAVECARQCALNALAVAASHLGNGDIEALDDVVSIVRMCCFVASGPEFTAHPKIANGASELLVDIFGERGKHTRAAVGSSSLPLGVPVELDMIIAVRG
jgi:enamine deaminase RidA (YjgF/YER057c/UK114 family)